MISKFSDFFDLLLLCYSYYRIIFVKYNRFYDYYINTYNCWHSSRFLILGKTFPETSNKYYNKNNKQLCLPCTSLKFTCETRNFSLFQEWNKEKHLLLLCHLEDMSYALYKLLIGFFTNRKINS